MMKPDVCKALIPVAGLGTRFLPATKAIPKEMLPIVDTPALQVVVEEILASGLTDLVLITGRNKGAIEDHFDHSYELEDTLERRGKLAQLEMIRFVSQMVRAVSVRQKKPLGLGHAVLCGKEAIGDETFAVLLPDEVFDAPVPITKQLLNVSTRYGVGAVALLEVPRKDTSRYGVIEGDEVEPGVFQIRALVEKPPPDEAPSTLAIPGRYILPAKIFDYLEKTQPGHGGEIQLTDGLVKLAQNEGLMGVVIKGERHDTGNTLGYLRANIAFALKREELREPLREYLKSVL